MIIHNRKELTRLKRYNKWKQINQCISIPILIFLFIVSIVLTVYISYEYLNYEFFIFDRQLTEFFCYSIWCVLSLYISCAFIRKKVGYKGIKIFTLFGGALVSTVVVFVLNSFWHYLDFNSMFSWKDPLAYWVFMKSDLLYTYNFGWIRYPSVFLGVFSIGMFLTSKFVLEPKQRIESKVKKHYSRYVEIQLTELENETHSAIILPFRLPDDKNRN